jgi:hypothetical protein
MAEFLDNGSFALLKAGRCAAFSNRKVSCDRRSKLIPALARYSGWAYQVEGFKPLIKEVIEQGTHCLIISAGYGLLRPEEHIYDYDAKCEDTRSIWREYLPQVLSAYVSRHVIKRVFIACSSCYAEVIHGCMWPEATEVWCLPKLPAGSRTGPETIGKAVVTLITAGMVADQGWMRCL